MNNWFSPYSFLHFTLAMFMVQVESLGLILTGLGLAASIVYYANILRNAERAKHRELILSRLRMTKEFQEAWVTVNSVMKWDTPKEFLVKYGPQVDPEKYATFIYLGGIYRNLGTILKEKIVEPDLLFSIYDPLSIRRTWEKYEPIVKSWRLLNNYPLIFSSFEYLYQEAVKKSPDSNVSSMEDWERYVNEAEQ